VFTPAAAAKVRELIHEEGNEALALRVYIRAVAVPGFSTVSSSTRTGPTTIWRW
jgi:Fe-S cluster assembly iron-binding protein IscA